MIPPAILAKGDKVALEYLLESTPLGAFFEREEVRRAIAEDILLEQFKPFVFTASFIDDDTLHAAWRSQRPEAYALARRLAEDELGSFKTLPTPVYEKRLKLRLSTYRKIDVWWCGSEIFIPSEALGAEPYFTITLPGYESQPVKIGQTRSSLYTGTDPKRDAVALELMQKIELLEPIERALFPLLPPEGPTAAQEWNELQSVLSAAEPFKAFSRQNKLPVFPKTLVVDPTSIPTSFKARFALDGSLWSNLYAMGISPILSQPAVDYLASKTRAITTLASQRNTLSEQLLKSIHFDTQ